MEMLELDASLDCGQAIEAGAQAVLRVRAHNRGADLAQPARIGVAAPESLALISPCAWSDNRAGAGGQAFVIPALLRDEVCEFAIFVFALAPGESDLIVRLQSEQGECESRVRCTSRGRAAFASSANRLEFFADEAQAGNAVRGRLILTNTGFASADVRAITFSGELDVSVEGSSVFELPAGERRSLGIIARLPIDAADGARFAVRASCIVAGDGAPTERTLGDASIVARSKPQIDGAIACVGPAPADVGERVDWRLRIDNVGGAPADWLTLALHIGGGAYVAGSSTLEGARLIDIGGTSPLWSPDGLRIEQLPAGAGATLSFATLGEPSESGMTVWARVVCDGEETLLESERIAIRDLRASPALPFVACVMLRGDGFASRRIALRRSQRACLEPAFVEYVRSLGGLMRHLWAMAVLCADESDDPDTDGRLAATRVALRSVFDRLAIKLRMPHYPLRADDVLDPAAEDALTTGSSDGTLGVRLARAALLIASEWNDGAEVAAYRDALHARLEAFADDAALIDALVAPQPALDERLDAVLEREIGVPA